MLCSAYVASSYSVIIVSLFFLFFCFSLGEGVEGEGESVRLNSCFCSFVYIVFCFVLLCGGIMLLFCIVVGIFWLFLDYSLVC